MIKAKYLIAAFIFLAPVLCALLGWNCYRMYGYEQKHVREEIEAAISSAADSELYYNAHQLSNHARSQTDAYYNDKITFAAGFTHNMGAMAVVFPDTNIGPAPQQCTPKDDTAPVYNGKFFKDNKISFKPQSAMTIRHFDPLFQRILARKHIAISYTVRKASKLDTAAKGYFISAPFIVDFFEPKVYCLHYSVPIWIAIRNIAPYLVSSLLLAVFMILGTVFFYRSYRLRQQQYRFRESLFGNITHELKTPLSSMQLIIDDARKHIDGKDTVSIPARHVQFAAEELDRMKLIVENILSFRKMDQQQFAFNQELVDLDSVIRDAVRAMEIKTAQANGILHYEPENSSNIPGNRALLTNMLTALIDNALKYTEREPVIRISLSSNAGNVLLCIKDNGKGIPAQYIKKIFDPFFRVPEGALHNVAGHGLGLSFVKQVMSLHKGRISVSSDNSGTTFNLIFNYSPHS